MKNLSNIDKKTKLSVVGYDVNVFDRYKEYFKDLNNEIIYLLWEDVGYIFC